MTGQWSGGAQNRTWQQPGRRTRHVEGDTERGPRLYALLAGERFLCETCGAAHPLREHRACRQPPKAGTR